MIDPAGVPPADQQAVRFTRSVESMVGMHGGIVTRNHDGINPPMDRLEVTTPMTYKCLGV
jgi:hypothetical protein